MQEKSTCSGCGKEVESIGILFHYPMCIDCMKETLRLVEMVIESVQLESVASDVLH